MNRLRRRSPPDVNLHTGGLTARHGVLLALMMACGLLVVGQIYVTIPLTGEVAARFGVAPARAALVTSAFGFAYAVGFLVFGPLSDRHGRRRVIVLGLAATALATAVVGFAPTFPLLLSARAVQGFAAAAFPPAAVSLIVEELPPPHRPLGVSLISFAFLGAAPLAQFFAARAAGGLPAVMFDLAPLYAAGAGGLLLVAGYHKPAAGGPAGPHDMKARLAGLFGDPGIVAAWGAASTVFFAFVVFYAGAQALAPALGVDLQMLRLAGLPPLLLTLAAAPLTRRCGAPVTARTGLVLAALALFLAVAGGAHTLPVASAALSAGVAFAVPGMIATVAGRAADANRGLALAVYTFCLFLGASVAPPVAQALAGAGTPALWLLPAVLLATAAFGLTIGIRRASPG